MTKKQFYKEIECTDTQNHLKKCKKCSPETNQEGWWIKEFGENFVVLLSGQIIHREQLKEGVVNPKESLDYLKSFISKVAKTERGKYPEGYQGEE